mmetsp:Transcript_1282/g.3171  ORF Transcript_1282/g.3171 Transcript_1282/m.3171 type:complete len:254 (+) Transcript_1282:342-1103(+)
MVFASSSIRAASSPTTSGCIELTSYRSSTSCSRSNRQPCQGQSKVCASIGSEEVEAFGYVSPPHAASNICAPPLTYFHWPCTSRSRVTRMELRGDVRFWPLSIGHMSSESIGGSPEAAAQWSVGDTPANPQSVAYQSAMCSIPSSRVPRTRLGRKPPEANAFTRIPPSNIEYLPPRSGQLLAPASPLKQAVPCVRSEEGDGGRLGLTQPPSGAFTKPPLSDVKIIRVFSHIPSLRMVPVTLASWSSRYATIAW